MKTVKLSLEDKEFKLLEIEKKKSGKTWERFILGEIL